jgi:hypothetical protein
LSGEAPAAPFQIRPRSQPQRYVTIALTAPPPANSLRRNGGVLSLCNIPKPVRIDVHRRPTIGVPRLRPRDNPASSRQPHPREQALVPRRLPDRTIRNVIGEIDDRMPAFSPMDQQSISGLRRDPLDRMEDGLGHG